MSDQHDKNIEQLAQETTASGTDPQAAAISGDIPAPAAPASAPPRAGRGFPALAWLAFLLVLVVAGGLAWSVLEQQRRDAGVGARLQALEAAAGTAAVDPEQLERRWQEQLNTALTRLQAETRTLDSQSGEMAQQMQAELARQGAELARQRSELARQEAELNRSGEHDRDDWLLAEAQYLLRMAHQRLVMARDVVATQTLLASADSILASLDDVRLHEVRAAIARDLAAVRAMPRVDVESVYLRLAALADQAAGLKVFELPQQAAGPEPSPSRGWRDRLSQGYETALARLSNYIIIRRRDVPVQALMDPQWEGLVRQNLRMLLEQAQVALLSGNQLLYRESLQRAQHWVEQFIASDEAAARAMSREITQLADLTVASTLPDISDSVQALDVYMEQRLQQGGAQ